MATNFFMMARKLQRAIKQTFNINLLLNTNQWWHKDKGVFINVYSVKQSIYDEDKQKYVNTELFTTYSQIQLVLFLRDLWYDLNNWKIPDDNPVWEQIKENYQKDKKPTSTNPLQENIINV